MNTAIQALVTCLLAATLPGLAYGQDRVKIVSVCELLADVNQYGNSVVAVVGRLDVRGVILDRHNYVSQDKCDAPLTTQGYVWPSSILIWTIREDGLPTPPTDTPELDPQILAAKLSTMSHGTILGVRKEFRIDKEGQLIDIIVRNQGVVAYGHTFYSPNLNTAASCKGKGCNGFLGQAPVVITVDPKNVHTVNEDGTLTDHGH
jgi:hypothetical protein